MHRNRVEPRVEPIVHERVEDIVGGACDEAAGDGQNGPRWSVNHDDGTDEPGKHHSGMFPAPKRIY